MVRVLIFEAPFLWCGRRGTNRSGRTVKSPAMKTGRSKELLSAAGWGSGSLVGELNRLEHESQRCQGESTDATSITRRRRAPAPPPPGRGAAPPPAAAT